MLNPFLEATLAKGDKKNEGLFDREPEAPKKYPPVEQPADEVPGHALNDGAPLHPHNQPDMTAEAVADILKANRVLPPGTGPVRRKLDPELKAMDSIAETLEGLTEQQRWRVINWCLSRFMNENNGNLPKPQVS